MSSASSFRDPQPLEPESAELAAAIEAAEAEVKRLEREILAAQDFGTAEAARRALTRAELRLWDLLDLQGECGSCEGWPRGK